VGWVAASLTYLSWAGFLGCTVHLPARKGGLKGLAISAAATARVALGDEVGIYGSAQHHMEIPGICNNCLSLASYSGMTAAAFICSGFKGAARCVANRVTGNWCYLRWRLG